MTTTRSNDKTADSESVLHQALCKVIEYLPDVPTQLKCRRRERVGKAFLLMAPFCLVVAFLPWPGATKFDLVMWIGFALSLLLLGGWQIDKAAKDEERASQMLGRAKPKPVGSSRFLGKVRRVK